ncbi:MAG: hypothetical protein KAJ18_10825 [Candidatus Omnitrophica bacterium]|nr:hypothetical protein [Candidatus Omnitrophota bacterium]
MGDALLEIRDDYWQRQFVFEAQELARGLMKIRSSTLSLLYYQDRINKNENRGCMRAELLKEYEKEFIYEISLLVDGIGKTTAGALAEYFDSFDDFIKASVKDLSKVVNSKGKSILNDDKIKDLLLAKKELPSGLKITEVWIYFLAKQFIRNQVVSLQRMQLDDIEINPLLAKVLVLQTPADIIRFNIYQSVTRSVVTSWGSMVERMLKFSGCELEDFKIGIKGREPDLVKKYQGKTYCLQIKSGPNTMNVDMVESLNKVIVEIEKKGCVGLLGMTYGRKDSVSQQILGNLKDASAKIKMGRDLWDFISETKNYHVKVIDIIDIATKKEMRTSYIKLIEDKVDEFTKVWQDKHGDEPINKILEEYI